MVASACHRKQIKKPVVHVIKDYEAPDADSLSGKPYPHLVFTYYGTHNFILMDSATVFYHDSCIFFSCGMGIDFTKPPRVYLAPSSFRKINLDSLPVFLKNLPTKQVRWRDYEIVRISSPTDTIKNSAFDTIMTHIKLRKVRHYTVGKWTEEEQHALTAKLENKTYNPDSIEWKTGFGYQRLKMVRFDPKELAR
ncbi:MAG: hypothetical protein K0S32_3487 [Bacteroidetes bacterium]|jgi:hypothetical protein|nr:hypothetical protein [Bacteroidota bacterium]